MYFKWDGRTGITAIVAICLTELMILANLFLIVVRIVNGKNERQMHPSEKWLVVGVYIALFVYNYKKYNKSYNKYRKYWKDETLFKRIYKGFFIVITLVAPWALAFWIGLS